MVQLLSKLRVTPYSRLVVLCLLVLAILVYVCFPKVYGAQLPQRYLQLSDDRVSVSTIYQLGFDIPNAETLGSVELEICANDPIFSDVCTMPTGFDISGAVLSDQSGVAGFTVLTSETNTNTLVLTRTPATTAGGNVSFTLQSVINPATTGSYYGRAQTFASADASGIANDYGGLAFSISNPLVIKSTVPPYLLFCAGISITGFDCTTASGNYVNFGNFSSQSTSNAQTQLLTATNADTGFNMYVYGPTMTSGNNLINAMATDDVSRPGISQFGINLVANQTPLVGLNPIGPGVAAPTSSYDLANWFKFASGDVIASANQATDYTKLTASYIVNVPSNQTPGVYVTSLTYVCLANF